MTPGNGGHLGTAAKRSRGAALLLLLALGAWPASPARGEPPPGAIALPASAFPVTVDGDPREALLWGALPLEGFDPVTGARDGRFRGYLLALPEGLYSAALDTTPKGETLAAGAPADPGDSLLGDWVALRVEAPGGARLFVLTPGRGAATLDLSGRPVEGRDDAWAGMERRFGHTWAAEWLLPWERLGIGPGGTFRAALVRGRKALFAGQALEVLATTAPGRSPGRFGAAGGRFSRPAADPPEETWRPRPLASYEVRPFVPAAETEGACRDAVPAGAFATAWFEVPPHGQRVRLSVSGAPAPAEFFRVDFWWQAGTREEQAALFPARAAAGEGDVLVAERLFALPGGELSPSPFPVRVYARMRVPATTPPGTLPMELRAEGPGRPGTGIAWDLRVVPALPKTEALSGVFYLGTDPAAWPADLKNMADHGIDAATCYARDPAGQDLFVRLAREVGIDGRFPMVDAPGVPAGRWGYTVDEPASARAIAEAAARARELRARGLRPWAALCWPRSLELLPLLDGAALAPGLLSQERPPGSTGALWLCLMGGREEPGAVRRSVAGLSRSPGLSGFWVWCYAARPGEGDDWSRPFYRSIACRVPDGEGGLADTVQWEALRDGIVDRRLAEAIGRRGGDPAREAPALEPARGGASWLPEGPFPHAATRAALARGWAQGST